MAYLKDKELIFQKMAVNKLPYYRVLDSDGKTILDAQDDEDCTVDEAVHRLRDTLEQLTGLITVVLSAKTTKQKGAGGNTQGDLRFSIKLTDENAKGVSGMADMREDVLRAAIAREYEAKMDALRKEFEHKEEMRKLQDQINELKNGDSLEKYMPMIAGLLGNQGAPIAGFPEQPHITGPADYKERLVSAINRIQKVDNQFIDNLERLADLAEKSPMVYKIAIDKLKSL